MMMMSEDAARQIHAQHWRQGRLLSVASHAEIAQQLSLAPLADDDAVIVISQSCDLVNGDFTEEPFAEILLAHPLPESADGNYMCLRNPRRLHFHLQIHGQQCAYTAWIWDRYWLPREVLAQWPPDAERGLWDQDEQDVLIGWLVARYERTALPDELQRRLGRIKDKLKKPMKQLKDVSGVFLECSDQELSDDASYRLRIKLVMPKAAYEQAHRRQAVEQIRTQLDTVLRKCPGVLLEEEPELVSELKFTLHDARILRRWTDFDYVSYQDHAAHQAPHSGMR
jgi:hypothetical protein